MTGPGIGLTLADQVAAESRRLEAMGRSRAPVYLFLAGVAAAALLHVGFFAVRVPRVSGPAPRFPARPDRVSVLRWIPPAPASTGLHSAPGVPQDVRTEAAPPVTARGSLPPWTFEPVPEPPLSPPLGALPADASLLPVPPPRTEPSLASPREVARPLPIPESKVEPEYPAVARAVRARGTVVLEVVVTPEGSVRRTRVLECTRPGVGFEEAAQRAVAQWSFRPGRVGDEPVEASTVVRVEFR